MAFRDLSEVLDAGLSLPINGKTYMVPPVDAETGLRLQRLAEVAAQAAKAAETGSSGDAGEVLDAIALDDDSEVDLYREALGTAYDTMVADRVWWPALKLAGVTAWLDAAVGREAAEAYWNAAGDPEALAGNRTRQVVRSTRRPASASGTTRTRTAKTAKTAAGARGRRSSTAGS